MELSGYLEESLEGKTFEDYKTDWRLRFQVERIVANITDQLVQMVNMFPELKAGISKLKDIRGFRNRIVHAYKHVSDKIVWDVANNWMPELFDEVRAILASIGERDD